ncbi:MAG: nucleotidyltransferase domain-containing protein [Armatimonadetes bacterium]|nr:nucleotidyltransferase domain-containing protein [Armatimonadota bacterium]
MQYDLPIENLEEALCETMTRFGDDLQEILGENLKSVILFGSAVLGDFTPGKGDLDFLVVTADSITHYECEFIFSLHESMRSGSNILARQLEGTYYPLRVVADPVNVNAPGCYVGTGRKGWKPVDGSKNSLMDYAIIKKHGRTCYGSNVTNLVYSPSQDELVEEFRKSLESSIATAMQVNSLNFALAMCHFAPRGLCFTLTGKMLSKKQSAQWFAEEFSGNKWAELVLDAEKYRYPLTESELNEAAPIIEASVSEFLLDIATLAGLTLNT